MDPQILTVVSALCVVLLTIVFYLIYLRSRTARRDVLLTGVCDSGKTLLFARLIHDKYADTYTSIRENVAEYVTEKGSVQIVDIPGYERLREKYLEQYKKTARALIYVIDSVKFQKKVRDIAEYLYIILTDPIVASYCKHVMIFCNKQDNPTAKGLPVIKAQLEKELNTVRMTKGSQLTSTDESGAKPVYLGSEDNDFEFSQCASVKFTFGEGCALNKEPDAPANIEVIEKWLDMVA